MQFVKYLFNKVELSNRAIILFPNIIIYYHLEMESNTHNELFYEVIKPTEKQFINHHLLHTVKQINGEIAFKHIHQKSVIIKFNERVSLPVQYIDYFGYVLQGEVFVYKHSKHRLYQQKYLQKATQISDKIFVTCNKSHQIFGLQEYPLNWSQKLIIQATQGTKIIMFPLDLSLTSFKKIFNLNMVQYRAEVLKRCELFQGVEIEKLKKIALYCKRMQGSKGQILIKQGDKLTHLIVLVFGEMCFVDQTHKTKKVFKKHDYIGLQHLMQDEQDSNFFLSCLSDCEMIAVPKQFVAKFHKIKYRLDDRDSVQIKSRRPTEFECSQDIDIRSEKKTERTPKHIKSVFFRSEIKDNKQNMKIRPNTSTHHKPKSNIRFSTFYDNSIPSKPLHSKTKTQSSQLFQTNTHQTQNSFNMGESISLGQLCLRKFLKRKERRENCEIMNYLKSNAPQLKLNPLKQYALVKPLHVCDSLYIKNMKRRLKHNNQLKNQDTKSKHIKPRFSFFFKEDGNE